MEPTLLVGDRLFVNKFTYGYSRHSFPFSPNLFNGRILNKKPEQASSLLPNNEYKVGCKKYDFYCQRLSKKKWLEYVNQSKSLLGSS